jgi:predicted transcriptional regulator
VGDRFYQQMLNKLGTCPGVKSKRKKRMAWTDEKKAEVIKAYEDMEPTPETSMECVTQLAEDFEESPNGVRTILSRAGVYVKKSAETVAKTTKTTGGTARVSKAAAQKALEDAIKDAGHEVDNDVVSKLTGKAALYLASVISKSTK